VQEPTVEPVAGKHLFKHFINYQCDRNRGDAHSIPPPRLGESGKLTIRKNPFFAHAAVELLPKWVRHRTWIYEMSRDVPPLFQWLADKVRREFGVTVRPCQKAFR
jgi:hypothetical protein